MTWMAFLIELTWKSALLLAAACLAAPLLRNRSASFRHFFWTAAFLALLLLPVAMLVMPHWGPSPTLVQTYQAVHAGPASPSPANLPASPGKAPQWLWIAGAAAAILYFLIGAGRTSWMVGRALGAPYAQAMLAELGAALGIRRPVRALQSSSAPLPLTWGISRPVVVLPEDASHWPSARLRTVLLHELLHVKRFDVLAQSLAHVACSLYWFNPLAWVALGQLRKERERACDDAVLLRGVPAPDYAGHLLDLVRSLAARRSPWPQAPAMAEVSGLESRVRALLDRSRNRRPVNRGAALAIGALVAAIVLPVASITAHAQPSGGVLAGAVEDSSGARVPSCRVVARNADGVHSEITVADDAGEYRFLSIPPGHYTLEFGAPGFALAKVGVDLVSGVSSRLDAHLEVGQLTESLTISGQKPPTVSLARPNAAPQRVLIGGSVQVARLVRQVRPVYLDSLKAAGVEGTVMIRAVISKEGDVLNPQVINTVDPALAQAALDAVRQWRYQPASLNGQPIEITTSIGIAFQLHP